MWLNGAPAARIDLPASSARRSVSVAVEDGRITHIYAMRNPAKLTRLDQQAELNR